MERLSSLLREKLRWKIGPESIQDPYKLFDRIVSTYGYSVASEIFREAGLPVPSRLVTMKIILIGDSGVGKTSLCTRFTQREFKEDIKSTVGVAFGTRIILVGNDTLVKAVIWDTAGQERFSSLRPLYYKGAAGGLVVFDVTRISSFDFVEKWVSEARSVEKDLPLLLVGNKIDLPYRKVSEADALKKVEKLGLLGYIETSAKTGQNVDEAFLKLIRGVLEKPCSNIKIVTLT